MVCVTHAYPADLLLTLTLRKGSGQARLRWRGTPTLRCLSLHDLMSTALVPPEIIERIVEEAFADKMRDDDCWDETALPKVRPFVSLCPFPEVT